MSFSRTPDSFSVSRSMTSGEQGLSTKFGLFASYKGIFSLPCASIVCFGSSLIMSFSGGGVNVTTVPAFVVTVLTGNPVGEHGGGTCNLNFTIRKNNLNVIY